jgi:HEPN domain-containing protein
MQQDNRRVEEASEWLRFVTEDLRLADLALDAVPPITGLALYHAQQAAEKALKAYLLFRGRAFPLTHDLTTLSRPLAELDAALLIIVLPHLGLSDFATLYRYPGEPKLPTLAQARLWVEAAYGIYAAVEERVKSPPAQAPEALD